MTPVGYMYKRVSQKTDWLRAENVVDIYSVGSCISEDFADWIQFWKHNGWWFFDNPQIIKSLAKENHISLEGMTLFYYSVYENQWHENHHRWASFEIEKSFTTNIAKPEEVVFHGYDIVSFSGQTSAECSPLSCNGMAEIVVVNKHCLLETFDEAKECLEKGVFSDCEPGPYRIFAVYTVELN